MLAFVLGAALADSSRTINAEPDVVARLGDDFAFDVVARSNEAVLANVDAIDTSLTAILAGTVAVLVFTIDKLRELEPFEKWIALGLLCGAAVGCVLGFMAGTSWRASGNGERIYASTFIPDFARQPGAAVANAIVDLSNATEKNLAIRLRKRILTVSALVLLLAGVAVVTAARLNGAVV